MLRAHDRVVFFGAVGLGEVFDLRGGKAVGLVKVYKSEDGSYRPLGEVVPYKGLEILHADRADFRLVDPQQHAPQQRGRERNAEGCREKSNRADFGRMEQIAGVPKMEVVSRTG